MNDSRHQDGIHPFPAVMQTRTIETNGTSIHVRVCITAGKGWIPS